MVRLSTSMCDILDAAKFVSRMTKSFKSYIFRLVIGLTELVNVKMPFILQNPYDCEEQTQIQAFIRWFSSPSQAASPATVNRKARADWRVRYEFKCSNEFKRQVYGRIIERSLALACIRHRLRHAVFPVRCVFERCEHARLHESRVHWEREDQENNLDNIFSD